MVRFSGVAERPAVSLNRGFSAPITLSVEQKADDQFFLAGHDSDPFSRWQAFNTLLTDALIAAFRQILGGSRAGLHARRLTGLAGKIAGDETLEPAYRALALALPGEADIARDIGKNIDPGRDLRRPRGAGAGDRQRQPRAPSPVSTTALPTKGRSARMRQAPGGGRCATSCSTISRCCREAPSSPPGISRPRPT